MKRPLKLLLIGLFKTAPGSRKHSLDAFEIARSAISAISLASWAALFELLRPHVVILPVRPEIQAQVAMVLGGLAALCHLIIQYFQGEKPPLTPTEVAKVPVDVMAQGTDMWEVVPAPPEEHR